MSKLLSRAEARQQIAEHILNELDLANRWNKYGTCHLVGAVAYHLVVAPDIDMEIFCPETKVEDGFEVLSKCALHPNVKKIRFWNALGPPHYGLYWQIRYDHEGEEWKIDMWSVADSYSLPCGVRLTEPMNQALTPESRETILRIKEAIFKNNDLECFSIQIYRAVLSFNVCTFEEFLEWLPQNQLSGVVTDWKPESKQIP